MKTLNQYYPVIQFIYLYQKADFRLKYEKLCVLHETHVSGEERDKDREINAEERWWS